MSASEIGEGNIPDLNSNFQHSASGGDTGSSVVVTQGSPRGPVRLERETSSWKTLLALCLASVALELCRQVCSYAMKYYNDDKFPIPSTFLVFSTEFLKLTVFATKMFVSRTLCASNSTISFAYLIPSTLYALNNNIYFVALYFTTPPVWNILMQSRVITTALVYRFYFKKEFTRTKWLALLVLTSAIVILQFTGSDSMFTGGQMSWDLIVALGLAAVASLFSAVGPVYTEVFIIYYSKMKICCFW